VSIGAIGPGKSKLSRTRGRTNKKVVLCRLGWYSGQQEEKGQNALLGTRYMLSHRKIFTLLFSALGLKKGSLLSFCVLRKSALLRFLFPVLE
jgi:hypothetical protein